MLIALGLALAGASLAEAVPARRVWGGGSGSWDTTTANWATTFSGAATSTFTSGAQPFFGYQGSPGTVTLAGDINAYSLTFYTAGYTLDLAGHSLTATYNYLIIDGDTTFDFAGSSSSASFNLATNPWSGALTITNFVAGSSSLKFSNGTTISSDNLALINFVGYSDGGAAQIDSNGYVTPVGTVAVPEPATWAALVGCVALAVAIWRRRTTGPAQV